MVLNVCSSSPGKVTCERTISEKLNNCPDNNILVGNCLDLKGLPWVSLKSHYRTDKKNNTGIEVNFHWDSWENFSLNQKSFSHVVTPAESRCREASAQCQTKKDEQPEYWQTITFSQFGILSGFTRNLSSGWYIHIPFLELKAKKLFLYPCAQHVTSIQISVNSGK